MLRNHSVHGVSVLPGVTYLDIVLRLLRAARVDRADAVIENVVFAEAITTSADADREVRCTVRAADADRYTLAIDSRWSRHGRSAGDWIANFTGQLSYRAEPEPQAPDLDDLKRRAARHCDLEELYRRARRENIVHGPAMRCTGDIWRGPADDPYLLALLRLERGQPEIDQRFRLHPALLDASTLAGFAQTEVSGDHPFIPMFVRSFRAPRPLTGSAYVYCPRPERLAESGDVITSDYRLHDEQGRFLAGFTELTCKLIRHPGLITRIAPDARDQAPDVLLDALRRLVASALRRQPAEVPVDVGFYDLGMDSLGVLALGRQLEDLVGESLYPTLLFEYGTIERLAGYLGGNYTIDVPAAAAVPPGTAAPDIAPELALSLRADMWTAEEGPVQPPSVLAVAGDAAAWWPAGQPTRPAVRILPVEQAASHQDILIVHDANAEPVAACAALTRLAAAAVDRPGARPARITVACPGEPDDLLPAALAAVSRTITAETPLLTCRVATGPADSPSWVGLAAADSSAESQLHFLAGPPDTRRLVRRWRAVSVNKHTSSFCQLGVYLISGGTGGLGQLLAGHLASDYRARVLLLSRSRPGPGLAAAIESWNAAGAEVRHVVCDVSSRADVEAAVAHARAEFGRINGVLHCAGERRDGIYLNTTAADFAAVFAAKVNGAAHLDAATVGDDLDFFAVYSSLSASVANPGQCVYAAANAAAEALVRGRAANPERSGRSVAIGWPYWLDGGMRAPEADGYPMPSGTGLAALAGIIDIGAPVVAGVYGPVRAADVLASAPDTEPAAAPRAGTRQGDTADPVVIIGAAGRYPQADDLDQFWDNLLAGRDCITEIPGDRWDHDAIYDSVKGRPGRTYGKWGGFIAGVDEFDAPLFGISRREAERMDPQERIFLMTCWHALEDAGYSPRGLTGRLVGVFTGVMWNHYQLVEGDADGVAPTAMHASVANRVSFTLDFRGPSIALDTACSSSLTAIHLAVQSLRTGECDLALAGGVNASVHPQKYLQLAQGHWLSTDGRCRSFGADGSGYVPGEGCGVVVLKRLSAALADGDSIRAVVGGTVIDHGGRTSGATVPNPASQAALIRAALDQAGWEPSTVSYVEAHGTGTSLGDPIEVDGLARAFAPGGMRPGSSCALGSVKSNIGHLESAAGVAGLTKVLLQLRHRTIAPSLHSERLNPAIDFASTPFHVPQAPAPWTAPTGTVRRAGISAFGAGGANAHLLVAEYPRHRVAGSPAGPFVYPLSARDDDRLREVCRLLRDRLRRPVTASPTTPTAPTAELITEVARLLGIPRDAVDPDATLRELGLRPDDLLELDPVVGCQPCTLDDTIATVAGRAAGEPDNGLDPADVAYTLHEGRASFERRLVVVADDLDELTAELERYAATGEPAARCLLGAARPAGTVHQDLAELIGAGAAGVVGAWLAGDAVDWAPARAVASRSPMRVSLPGYPFEKKRYWVGAWRNAPTLPALPALPALPDHGASGPADEGAVSPYSPPAVGDPLALRVLDDHIALITLRQPMFTPELISATEQAFARLRCDDAIRCVIVTGDEAIFSMGGTPEALRELAAGNGRFSDVPIVYEGMLHCDRPVVVAMQGHAAGGGLAFGLYGDVVIMSHTGEYRANFVDYGFTPGMGATHILERKLGASLAAEMMLTARAFSGAELARRGADVTVVDAAEVLPAALRIARSIARKPEAAVRALKSELAGRTLAVLPEVINREQALHEEVLSRGAVELVAARFGGQPQPAPPATAQPAAADHQIDPGEVRHTVMRVLGNVLYLDEGEIDQAGTFAEMGLDSVGAVELVSRLNREWHIDLDSVAIYSHPTIDQLSELVAAECRDVAALQHSAAQGSTSDAGNEQRTVPDAAGPVQESVTLRAISPPAVPDDADADDADADADDADAIAIVGMAARFPGAADPEAFWRNLAAGRCAIAEVPRTRWDLKDRFKPERGAAGTTDSKWAALLDRVDTFDERFFRLSPLDAQAMDPQQRLFLEEAWAALENAGYAADLDGPGRPWGVFAGCGAGDYADLLADADRGLSGQAFLGNAPSILPARIAYLLNMTGPTMAVDTACSSSLAAVHLAAAAIQREECEVALAGGVAVMSTEKMQVWTSQAGMLSPRGECRPFDASADGIVLGEGVGVVVLKRLSRALADGDTIHGVIRGSGMNGDGKSNGITAPNANAQIRLLRAVYDRCGVAPADITYVEAHGTGTRLGDPIEVAALNAVFAAPGRAGGACDLGSVKGNVGHTTLAAGVAGLVKVLLALRHGQLPPSGGYTGEPNPEIDFGAGPLRVVTELKHWAPGPTGQRIAAVSSFGFSGTNCHLVVSEPPRSATRPAPAGPELVLLSARTSEELAAVVSRLADRLRHEPPRLDDLAFTLAAGRPALGQRAAFVAAGHAELLAALDGWQPMRDGAKTAPDEPAPALAAAELVSTARESRLPSDLRHLADAYRAGADADWALLFEGREVRRIPLPTYPFAPRSHWITARTESGPAVSEQARPEMLHAETMHAEAMHAGSPLARGHKVAGHTVLPAAASITLFAALARKAGRRSAAVLQEVRWLRPVLLDEAVGAEVEVRIDAGGRLTLTAAGQVSATARVADPGEISAPRSVDVNAIAAACPRVVDVEALYRDFAAGGLEYGGDFRALSALRAGDGVAVGTLRTDAPLAAGPAAAGTAAADGLPPAVIDTGIQAAAALTVGDEQLLLPFSADHAEVLSTGSARYSIVHARGPRRFDVEIAAADGTVCLAVHGLTLRPAAADEPRIFSPVWVETDPPAQADPLATEAADRTAAGRVAVVGDAGDSVARALLAGAAHGGVLVHPGDLNPLTDSAGCLPDTIYWLGARRTVPEAPDASAGPAREVFTLLKHLIRCAGRSTPLRLVAVTRNAFPVRDSESAAPEQAAVTGLLRAAAAEYPAWDVRIVDTDPGGVPADVTTAGIADARIAGVGIAGAGAPLVALRDGRRLTRRLAADPPVAPAHSPWHEGGCYLLLGGAGGIGIRLARHLAETAHARIALVGRRADNPQLASIVADLERRGGQAGYWQADATNLAEMRRVVESVVTRFGPISGAVQCALHLRDRSLATMTETDLVEVLAPKVDGSINLVQALDGQPLEQLVFFSSALSFADAPGQGNYAAASHFEDAYAAALRARGFPAAVVNWGFWGTVGAVATTEQRRRFAQLGIEPIEPDEGMRALDAVLSSGRGQSVIVKGSSAGLARLGVVEAGPATVSTTATPSGANTVEGFAVLEGFARAFASTVLRPLIDAALRGGSAPAAELARMLGVEPRQQALFHAALSILGREGVIREVDDRLALAGPDDMADRAERLERDLLASHPALRPHIELTRTCVLALPDVLSGRVAGLDVLFPRGTTAQVEAVYVGNSAADHHHRLLALRLAGHVRAVTERERRPARVLEVGAGTGSASRFVVAECADQPEPPELMITDVSRAFVTRAQEQFAQHPWVSCAVFDVERAPGDQGLAPATFDVVYATNVIHATADVALALSNAAALLRPGGLLLVNEITQPSDFATLTFGLTSGWWRFRDVHRRLPHGPLLDVAGWEDAFRSAGLETVGRLCLPSTDGELAAHQCVLVGRVPDVILQPAPVALVAPAAPPDAELARQTLGYLRRVFAEVLKFSESELDPDATFEVFGIDSLVTLNIIDRLQEDLGSLPSTLLFEHLTLRALADHLVTARRAELPRIAGVAPASAGTGAVTVSPQTAPLASVPLVSVSLASGSPAGASNTGAIAVIGAVGRYPGSPDLESFWHNLRAGRSCVREVPADRWDWREHFDERRAVLDKTYCHWGGFLDDVDLFDPGFFGVLPKDAVAMDPQERLFLEASWTLLQDAGYLGRRREARTGVFVGTMYGSYGQIASANGWPGRHFGDGHSPYWAIANRVSYTFDFRGPSFAVDSACSSSATAVHLACESLRRGECGMAIAGGVNLILHPAHFIALSQMGMLSASGQCRVFDESADGFVPGEGIGAVLLKPLHAAEADGDDIWAVIRGSLANSGGKTSGFTVPNPGAQAELIAEALRRSGLTGADIGYVEAHGTGTALGDPIEISALARALGDLGDSGDCVVGSVKSMIGHLEGASGIAGLTKAILQLRHQTLVPQPGFGRVNPKIDLDAAALRVPAAATRWETSGVRRAGVSSFGAGGANVHLVVEEHRRTEMSEEAPGAPHLVLLCARDHDQLQRMALDLEQWIDAGRIDSMSGLAFTSQVGRAEFPFRLGVLGADLEAVSHALRAFRAGQPGDWAAGQSRSGHAGLLDDADGRAFMDTLLAKRSMHKLAQLWVDGADVDWRRLWDRPRPRVAMPPYPWDRRRFWLPERGRLPERHEHDAMRIPAVTLPSWLSGQHLVNGQRWAPAAVLLDAVERACALPGDMELREVRLLAPLVRDDGEVAVDFEPDEEATGFVLRDVPGGRVISTGRLISRAAGQDGTVDLAAVRTRCTRRRSPEDVYAALRGGGLEHGPALRVLGEVSVGDGEVLAKIIPTGDVDPAQLPAIVLDGAFQALAALPGPGPAVPSGFGAVRGLSHAGSCCWVAARELPAADGRRRFDIALTDESGAVLTAVDSMETAALPAAPAPGPAADQDQTVVRLLRPAWTSQARVSTDERPRRVLVLADDEVGQHLLDELRAVGASPVLVLRGTGFRVREEQASYELCYERENFRRLISGLRADGAEPDAVVQWIGPARTGEGEAASDVGDHTRNELETGLFPLLWTAGALLSRHGGGQRHIVVGYHGADAGRPAMAGLGGALRSLALESSGLRGTLMEFAGTAGTAGMDAAAIARELCAELTSALPGDARVQEVRLDGGRHVRTLERFDPGAAAGQAAQATTGPTGVWLMTGGAGRIGRHLAAHLARRPGNCVVLAGRRRLDAAARDELSALACPSSTVCYEQADVSDGEQARALVTRVHDVYGPVVAVVHAAGVHHDALVSAKTDEQIRDVLAPKVLGIERLDAALADEPLELVVLSSSHAAWTGNLGQSDYTFANAYLDSFASRREALRGAALRRGRTVSIGWPLWAEGGMTVDEATAALHARVFRSVPLPTAAALATFDQIVASGIDSVFVSSELPAGPRRPEPAPVTAAHPPASQADVVAVVEDELRAIAAEFLLVEPRHVDMTADLLDTGFDSISLTKLVNVLNDRYDLTLLPTVLFEQVNLADFAAYLAQEHGDGFLSAGVPQPGPRRGPQAGPLPGREPMMSSPAPELPMPSPAPDDVAIVGLAAIMPGCRDLGEFWTHLISGACLAGPPPGDRREILQNPATAGVLGGFLAGNVRRFDAALFGISPREAAMMDPQQRLFLETVWRAIEDAGYPPSAFAGTATGLFVGVSACDYDDLLREHGVTVEAHTASGVASCILANRVSHHFDLRGPSEAIDTACSSSLVALHHAVRSIQTGECDQAIVGGVNLLLSPGLFEAFTKSGMLSLDGRCKAFDEAADGYGRGEGVGAVLLKRASNARAAADRMYAIVRGSAMNHGGHANSLTAPNPRAQAEVIVAAYRRARIDPSTIGYVEAHGTGTALGDPVEIEGLRRAFAEFGVTRGEVGVGTVKSVVGHLEAAAGMAGLIKMLLCAEHGQLPPNANFRTANPYLRLGDTPFQVNTELREWTGVHDGRGGTVRRAAISSFGFGGTNAHVVLDAVASEPVPPAAAAGPFALPLSAPTVTALRQYASLMAGHLAGAVADGTDSGRDDSPGGELIRTAYTLQVGRAELEYRACVLAADAATAIRLLEMVADGESGEFIWTGRAARSARAASGDQAAPADVSAARADDLAALCARWVTGTGVDWSRRWPGPASRSVLPSFPFAETEFWFDDVASVAQEVTMPDQRRSGSSAGAASPASMANTTSNGKTAPKITLAALNRVGAQRRAAVSENGSAVDGRATPPSTPSPSTPPPSTTAPSTTSSSAPAIRSMLAAVLGCGQDAIDDDAPFGDLGLDSIFRMELVRHLTSAYELTLQSEQLYEYDSVSALARFIDGIAVGSAPAQYQNLPDHPDATRDLREMVRKLVDEVLEREFDFGRSFADNGVTSFEMLQLVSTLESQLGPLPKTLLFDYPTLDELAAELTERYGSVAWSPGTPETGTRPGASPVSPGIPMPTCHLKRALADEPDIEAVVARLHAAYGKEDGLAGRDIAPRILLGYEREGYFHVGIGRGALLAWNYTGPEEYFTNLAGQLMAYARANGLRPNFLSLRHLETVGGEPVTATPFGAVQRIENLDDFDLAGSTMNRLRYMIRRFERRADVRVEEYRAGGDPATDAKLAEMVDSWTQNKAMVNPYVGIVREEIRSGSLTERHRVFLTYRDSDLVNAIVITRMASEKGYLLDVEFYPPEAPLGGLETAIVRIIEQLRAEGDKLFSFGASFGVHIASSANAAPEIEQGLEELRNVGIFGEGNFRFKNKFRPANIPIYLCQPASEPRTSLADVILLIASPDLAAVDMPQLGSSPRPESSPRPAGSRPTSQEPASPDPASPEPASSEPASPEPASTAGFRQLLAAHGYNPLAIAHDDVPVDFGTDSWAELDGPQLRARIAELDQAAANGPSAPFPPPWLAFRHVMITGSGKSATAMLCRSLRRRGNVPRNAVLHNAVFPTWMPPLIEGGFEPVDISRSGSPGEWDDALVEARLADPGTVAVCIELATNSSGGAPVPASRLSALRRQATVHGVPVILDATRVVDNVLAEGGTGDPWSAVSELLALGDLVMMSLTKNFGVPVGGLVATNDDQLARVIGAEARARGPEIPLTLRKLVHAALADTERVADMVRQRAQAVRALWEPLHAAGLPVTDPHGAHCVLLDTARLDACKGFEHPQLACLSWVFEHTGVRGAPHLATAAPLDAAVRFAVPVGMTPAAAARAGAAIADALSRTDGPRDLVAVQDGSDLASAAFHPRVAVPQDVAEALRGPQETADQNAAVLAEACPAVRRLLLRRGRGTVEVFVAGHGPTVVLLPPFNIGAGIFARQFSGLAGRARLIAVHHPGLGSSSGADDLTLDGLSDLVAEVLRELEVTEPVHMCGASFGGLPALTFVLRYPQRSRSLTLLGSSFKIGNRVGEVNRLAVVAREDFDAVVAGSGSARVAAGRAEWERTLLRCESMDARTGLRYLDVFAARPSLRARLPEIDVPTLVVHGRHDTVIPLKTAHLLHGLIPDSEYVELPDAGHFPGLTDPDAVNAAIDGLFRNTDSNAAATNGNGVAASAARRIASAGQS